MDLIKDGIQNSKFFHALMKECRRKLFIHRLKDETGQLIEDRLGITH